MHMDLTKVNRLIEERPDHNSGNQRAGERRLADAAIGNEVERLAAIYCMQHSRSVQKITRFDFDVPEYPAGFFGYENDEEGEGWDHFVAFDLFVSGQTTFLAEVKHKPSKKSGAGAYYPLDVKRLQRMRKAYRHASDLQHLFVVFDSKRKDAPAYGFFAVTMDQLIANASTYTIQRGFGETVKDFYKIPTKEFRPLSYFLKQRNPATGELYVLPEKPLSITHEAA